ALWLWRNHVVSATWTGARDPHSPFTLGQNLVFSADILSAWFLPDGINPVLRLALISLVIGATAALGAMMGRSGMRPQARRPRPSQPLLLFILSYSFWLIV